ncbi:glycosyltransferase family 2 protein [Brachybacterium hainanense]|uniref:Glucosyl-3-phosphoglycerate synthase n=1 Tax=Brachybacterium hainanense TaxID=1541174 RepID=A0ABV6RG76_9MICO
MTSAGQDLGERPTSVAVVIPAKNEAARIEATIRAARSIDRVDLVVVVDDGSTDATSAVAMGADALVVRHRSNQGKAAAMATGAQVVALREDTARADGREATAEDAAGEEPRVPGHTGPLPVIGADLTPRALLFLDADMEESAAAAAPLVDAVLDDGVDMAIALLPPQPGAGGMGIVVGTSRNGIRRATGWEPQQPLSGTRCITRQAWEACQPLAAGWGVETSLSIDALAAGFDVEEIPCDLHHRATGKDLRGQLHRAAQLRDVLRALAKRRHILPAEDGAALEMSGSEDEHASPPVGSDDPDDERERPRVAEPDAQEQDADRLVALPVDGEFSPELARMLEDHDPAVLDARLRALPVAAPFAPDDVVFLAGIDLDALRRRLEAAPVEEPFTPDQTVLIAAHLALPTPRIPAEADLPLTPEDYARLVAEASAEPTED